MEEQREDVEEGGVAGVASPLEVVKVAVGRRVALPLLEVQMMKMPAVTSPLEVVQAEVGWWVVSPRTIYYDDDVMERRGLEDGG